MGKVQEISRKLAQAISAHDSEAVDRLYAQDAVVQDPFYPEPLRGVKAIHEDNEIFFRALPEVQFEILTAIAEDDRSGVIEIRFSGQNTGPLATPQGEIPPTNKRVDLKGASFIRLDESGKIVEERRYYDTGTMMRQLGLMPEAAKPEGMTAH